MNKKIFRYTFLSALLVLLLSLVLIAGVLFDYFEDQMTEELKTEAAYLSLGVEEEGSAYLSRFSEWDKRITLISPTGEVLVDTSADASTMDNHLGRAEVAEAIKSGSGSSVRYSDTLTEKTIYYALRLQSGEVLRVSTVQYTVERLMIGLIEPLIIILIVALGLSILLSSLASKSIVKPLNELNLEEPEKNEVYEELTPLLRKISAQKRLIKEQIREAEQKKEEFRLITENMSEGFLVMDRDTNLLTYNRAAGTLLGIDENPGGSVFALNRTKDFREIVSDVLSGTRTERIITIAERAYRVIANPVFSGEEVIGSVMVLLDVTESAQREQLRREFTSNVSHELKTPLTSISGFAEMMKEGETAPETVKDFSASIYEEAQRLISLVNDIIKISELDEKEGTFPKEEVDLYALSKEIVERITPVAEKKGVKLHLAGDRVTVSGARKILGEMVGNLLDNAVKYNKNEGNVHITLTEKEDSVTLTVEDTGIGIPKGEEERVFERFYRVDKARSKAMGGTGLGLSIVKHGALFHGADLSLESTEGVGTKITLTFHEHE